MTVEFNMSQMIPAWVNGVLTPVDKLQVHVDGLPHKAVSVFVMYGKNVLIQRRALTKYHTPGLWANTCCTHPEWGEDPADCAVRRLNEELGIAGLYPTHQQSIEYRAEVGNGMVEHEFVEIFLASASPDLKVTPNPSEVMQVEWVDLYDLAAEVARHPAQFTPWLQIYLREHKDEIFGKLLRV